MGIRRSIQTSMIYITLRVLRQFIKSVPEGTAYRYLSAMPGRKRSTALQGWVLISIVFLITPFTDTEAQRKLDPGFFMGTSFYMGDYNPSLPFYQPSVSLGPILRYNFDERLSFRAHAFYHSLRGDLDLFNSFQPVEPTNFEASFVDLAVNFEFNWWPYKTAFRKSKYTPYVLVGLGYGQVLQSSTGSVSHLTMPFGAGMKVNLGKRLSGGVECSGRKTFSDLVDGLQNFGSEGTFSLIGNNDWYVFTGVFVTYKIFEYRDDCPTYEEYRSKRKRH